MKLDWLTALKFFGPMVLAQTKAAAIAPFILAGIEAAEKIPGATGAVKLAAAKDLARLSIGAVNAQAKRQVVNPVVSDQVIEDGIATVIGVVNLVHRSPAAA